MVLFRNKDIVDTVAIEVTRRGSMNGQFAAPGPLRGNQDKAANTDRDYPLDVSNTRFFAVVVCRRLD
eukprot:COSAG02_NODE_58490_length_277_cov_0.584270_1_plen_67_part_00